MQKSLSYEGDFEPRYTQLDRLSQLLNSIGSKKSFCSPELQELKHVLEESKGSNSPADAIKVEEILLRIEEKVAKIVVIEMVQAARTRSS